MRQPALLGVSVRIATAQPCASARLVQAASQETAALSPPIGRLDAPDVGAATARGVASPVLLSAGWLVALANCEGRCARGLDTEQRRPRVALGRGEAKAVGVQGPSAGVGAAAGALIGGALVSGLALVQLLACSGQWLVARSTESACVGGVWVATCAN